MKRSEIIEQLRSVVKQSWGKDLRRCTIEPIVEETSCAQSLYFVYCYLSCDGLYSRAHLEQVKERLNAYDYTMRVTPASLLVAYFVHQE